MHIQLFAPTENERVKKWLHKDLKQLSTVQTMNDLPYLDSVVNWGYWQTMTCPSPLLVTKELCEMNLPHTDVDGLKISKMMREVKPHKHGGEMEMTKLISPVTSNPGRKVVQSNDGL
jgi:hypothetical protein